MLRIISCFAAGLRIYFNVGDYVIIREELETKEVVESVAQICKLYQSKGGECLAMVRYYWKWSQAFEADACTVPDQLQG